jgi:hypothetical protein
MSSASIPEGPGSVSGAPNLPPGFANTFSSRYIDAGEVRLHAVIGGDGPPLLLVHGWPETWYAWRLVMPALARDFEVIAVDQRGIGLSDKPEDGYDTWLCLFASPYPPTAPAWCCERFLCTLVALALQCLVNIRSSCICGATGVQGSVARRPPVGLWLLAFSRMRPGEQLGAPGCHHIEVKQARKAPPVGLGAAKHPRLRWCTAPSSPHRILSRTEDSRGIIRPMQPGAENRGWLSRLVAVWADRLLGSNRTSSLSSQDTDA